MKMNPSVKHLPTGDGRTCMAALVDTRVIVAVFGYLFGENG